jgi:nucleotide-binding universal stress UspA family protein
MASPACDDTIFRARSAARVQPESFMYRNILVAVDGSPTSDRGLQHAAALAAQQGARLTVVYVLDIYAAVSEMQMAFSSLYDQQLEVMRRFGQQVLDKAATAAAAAGVQAQCVLREVGVARVADVIAEEAAKGFDLLVLGTHGRRGFRRFMLGSDAELVLRMSPIPVLLVRSDESKT